MSTNGATGRTDGGGKGGDDGMGGRGGWLDAEGVALPGAVIFFSVQQLAMQAVRRVEGATKSDC